MGSLGALRMVNMVQNGHKASPGPLGRVSGGPQRVHGVSLDGHESSCEGLYGPEWSPGAFGRVSGGPERVHGAPTFEILSFLQPLWCDLHVFQGPTWDRMPRAKWPGATLART